MFLEEYPLHEDCFQDCESFEDCKKLVRNFFFNNDGIEIEYYAK